MVRVAHDGDIAQHHMSIDSPASKHSGSVDGQLSSTRQYRTRFPGPPSTRGCDADAKSVGVYVCCVCVCVCVCVPCSVHNIVALYIHFGEAKALPHNSSG